MDGTPQTRHVNGADLRRMARAIPDETPVQLLHSLQDRYRSTTDPVVAATPAAYRRALLDRITHLLATSPSIPTPAAPMK